MQRLHEEDLCGFLTSGKGTEKWDVLKIPVLISGSHNDADTEYCRYLDHGLSDGPLWPVKHDTEQIETLKKAPHSYASQFNQNPVAKGVSMIPASWFGKYDYYDASTNSVVLFDGQKIKLIRRIVTTDTALTKKTTSDYSVFMLGGTGADGNIYILDLMRGKWDAIDLKKNYISFCSRHTSKFFNIDERYCELKAAGHGLTQDINQTRPEFRIKGLERNIDKVTRVAGVSPKVSEGRVFVPKYASWVDDFLDEVGSFNELMTHAHDDMVDTFCDQIEILGSKFDSFSYL
jgi:predicted phage terminase large subunit-like protein